MNPTLCDDARWQRNAYACRADIGSYACRQDENRCQILDDLRYARMLEVLGMGRGLVKQLITYEQASEYSSLDAANTLEGGINAATAAYGYYSAQKVESTGWGAMINSQWGTRQSSDIKASTIAVPSNLGPPPVRTISQTPNSIEIPP